MLGHGSFLAVGGASQLDDAGRYGTFQHLRSTSALKGETMAGTKTATLTFRIEPGLKEALRAAAEREHRSIANMVEVMIREYCRKSGVSILPGSNLGGDNVDPAKHSA